MRGNWPVTTLLGIALAIVACGDGGGFPDAFVMMPPQDPGTVALSWTLVDGSAAPETCATANGATVVVAITQEGTNEQFGQSFPCSLGLAVSGSLPTASYDLTFSLYDPNNTLLSNGMEQAGVAVTPDHTTDVGQIVFTVQ